MDMTRTCLVDELYSKSGLQYLSDMCYESNWRQVLSAVEEIPATNYSNEEWLEAYQYITRDFISLSSGKSELTKVLRGEKHEIKK